MIGSPETIFDLIADMPNYGRWLLGSEAAFGATTQVSPYPVRLGTTYLDAGPAGERPGSVTRFDRPKSIAFHHNMLLKRWPLIANIDAHILYTIEPIDSITAVTRDIDLTFQIPGIMKLAEPLVLSAFRKENVRLLPALKCYVEAQRN
jgi:hypothetical protein